MVRRVNPVFFHPTHNLILIWNLVWQWERDSIRVLFGVRYSRTTCSPPDLWAGEPHDQHSPCGSYRTVTHGSSVKSSSLLLEHCFVDPHDTRIVPISPLLSKVDIHVFRPLSQGHFHGLARLTICLNKNFVYSNRNIKFLWTNLNYSTT